MSKGSESPGRPRGLGENVSVSSARGWTKESTYGGSRPRDRHSPSSVEMESLQFVGCSWFIGLIGLVSDSPEIKVTENRTCVHSCPFPVSSRPHLDAPGVHSLAGYVAIPPRALTDPDSREFSDSLLFKPTDTGRNLNCTCPLLRTRTLSDMGRPRQAPVYLASHTHGTVGLCKAGSSRLAVIYRAQRD